MSNELVPAKELNLATPESLDKFDSLTKTSDFLSQLRVYGSESSIVKEGQFPMGHLGLYFAQNNIVDLGTSTNVLVVSARPRASVVVGEQPVSFYNYDSPEFTDVKDKAFAKMPGYLVGLEYLLYFPSIQKFGLFLMGSTTLRRESANLKALIGQPATITIKLIKTTKYTWHGVQIFPCSTPFDPPDMEALKDIAETFNNPVESKVELAPEQSSGRAR